MPVGGSGSGLVTPRTASLSSLAPPKRFTAWIR
jgi:hypothetical protein